VSPYLLDGQNEIEIELYLPGLEAIASNGLPEAPQDNTASHQPESEPSADSRAGESGTTTFRCKPVEYRPSLPMAPMLERFSGLLRW